MFKKRQKNSGLFVFEQLPYFADLMNIELRHNKYRFVIDILAIIVKKKKKKKKKALIIII